MRVPGKRIRAVLVSSVAAAALLGAGLLSGTAAVAAPADRLTTLRGTVTAADGRPLAGIRVTAGPYEVSVEDRDAVRSVRTSADGRYRVRVPAGALYMKFEDPAGRYFGAVKERFTAKAGTTHRVDRVLVRVSQIAGSVRDEAGRPLGHVVVRVYDAATGQRSPRTAATNRSGHYHLLVEAGRYKVRFASDGAAAEWYGDATTRTASPTVAVGPGAKRTGVDAVLG